MIGPDGETWGVRAWALFVEGDSDVEASTEE
jgi:hypothetical protein